DGDAGFRDVRGEHHFAFSSRGWVDCRSLLVEIKFTMQWAEQDVLRVIEAVLQASEDPTDLCLAGQKDKHAAGLLLKCIEARGDDPGLDVITRLLWFAPDRRDRVHPAFAGHDGGIV